MQCVKDIMTRSPVTIPVDATIDAAIDVMVTRGISGLPVVDKYGRLVGIITEYDVLHLYNRAGGRDDLYEPCEGFMTRSIRTISQDASLDVAASIFHAAAIRRLMVVDGERLTGILSRRDVLRCIREQRGLRITK